MSVENSGGDPMAAISARLEALNLKMAEQQLQKAEKVMPAATAKAAAGNASS